MKHNSTKHVFIERNQREIKGHEYLATMQCTLTCQLSWLYLHRKIKGHVRVLSNHARNALQRINYRGFTYIEKSKGMCTLEICNAL